MRTPEFLNAMRTSMAMGAQWRKVWMDFFSYWQQNFVGARPPGAEYSMPPAELGQSQMLAALEMMTSQLKRLGDRIEALEQDSESSSESDLTQATEHRVAAAKKPLKRRVSKNGRH